MVGKDGGVGLTTLPPACADCFEIWEPQPPGNVRACPVLYSDCFNFTFLFGIFSTIFDQSPLFVLPFT